MGDNSSEYMTKLKSMRASERYKDKTRMLGESYGKIYIDPPRYNRRSGKYDLYENRYVEKQYIPYIPPTFMDFEPSKYDRVYQPPIIEVTPSEARKIEAMKRTDAEARAYLLRQIKSVQASKRKFDRDKK